MAELDIRQPESNIYSNVEDSEALPLFVRYTSDDAKFHDKDATVTFEDTIAQLSGTHTCYLIHRRQKGRNKVYEELAIKFDELPFCMTAQLALLISQSRTWSCLKKRTNLWLENAKFVLSIYMRIHSN